MTKKCKRCQREIDSKAKTCPHCQADQRNWLARHRVLAILAILLVLFTVLNIFVSQMYTSQLILNDVHCANLASHDVNQKLQCLISGLVGKDSSVKNIELAVTKGDGSYSWAGAVGIANQHGQIPMTKETPNYIASATKVYTATAIMKLAEEKALCSG